MNELEEAMKNVDLDVPDKVDTGDLKQKQKPGPKPKIKTDEPAMLFPARIRTVLNHSIANDLPALLVGDTGTGKTSYVRELAREHGKDVIRVNLTGQTSPDEFVGKILANEKGTYWQDGPVIHAMRTGKWIVLDEVNMAPGDILSRIHSLLDDDKYILLSENDNEIVKCHKDFRFFATMNPSDDYAGTKEINKAFMSRFPMIITCEYSEHEAKILTQRTKIDPKIAERLVLIAKEIRHHKKKSSLTYVCSTRDLLHAANLIANGLDLETAIEISILNKASSNERESIIKLISLITSNEIKFPSGAVYKSITEIIDSVKKYDEDLKNARKTTEDYKRELETKIKEIDELKKKTTDIVPALERERARNKALADQVKKYVTDLSKLTSD